MLEKLAVKESQLDRVLFSDHHHAPKAESCVGSWLLLVTGQEEEEVLQGSRSVCAGVKGCLCWRQGVPLIHLETFSSIFRMDYAPYLVVCRDQTFAGAYEKFQWQDILPRQEMTRNRAGGRDGGGGGAGSGSDFPRNRRRHGDTTTQAPSISSWHRFASVEIGSALDTVRSALSWRRSTTDKQGVVVPGRSSTASQGTTTDATSSQTKRRTTKKVSFADDMGLALTNVRIICDSVSSYLQRTRSSYSLRAHSGNDFADTSQFLVKFAQPWSCSDDTFRPKVQSCNVILSDFLIQDGVIHGEIEVRNIAYEKTVFIRYTSSEWSSSTDVCASYVARSEQKFPGYDTFSFQFPVPLDVEKPGRMEFAVCYLVAGQTFWDNNGGHNYEIVKVMEESRTPDEDDVSIFQEFQGWRLDSHSEKGGSGGGKVVRQGRQQQNTMDRIVFSFLQQKKPIEWTEYVGWKWDMDYTRPYW